MYYDQVIVLESLKLFDQKHIITVNIIKIVLFVQI